MYVILNRLYFILYIDIKIKVNILKVWNKGWLENVYI